MPELEASLIFIMSLLTYAICELPQLKLAAIVAIFVFGIMQSHYNRYNLSEESIEKAGYLKFKTDSRLDCYHISAKLSF